MGIWYSGPVKTTLEISDAVFEEAKRYAARHGISFRELVEVSLRHRLDSKPAAGRFRLRKKTFHAETLIDTGDWPAVRKLVYEGRGE